MHFSQKNNETIKLAEEKLAARFKEIEETAYKNQLKVIRAFQKNGVQSRHFSGSTGYGYGDDGRDKLNAVYADAFDADSAIASPLIASGTHALTLMLFGILRPGDTLLSITGEPYDTLTPLISGEKLGSLKDFDIKFECVPLLNDELDTEAITRFLTLRPVKAVFIQRSRGYNWRPALSIEKISAIIKIIKTVSPKTIIAVDNCYGEFVEEVEPTAVGADIMAGSLIKNAGGGLAPTGGYVAGKKRLVELVSYRLTTPAIGCEIGSYAPGYLAFYQGLFLAPVTVAAALKGSMLFGQLFSDLGYDTLPKAGGRCYDIIRSIKFNTEEELISFCQKIQKASPVDSAAVPEPWQMPGYQNQVIMAAGTFIQGASIELSADSPIKEPYIAYFQGGLTYEHIKIAAQYALEDLICGDKTKSGESLIEMLKLMPIAEISRILQSDDDDISEWEYINAYDQLLSHAVRVRYNITKADANELYFHYRTNGKSVEETIKILLEQ
ncbi:MAG TPA: methionine gamma-lyase family protein, partial [Clostridia bacterium]|nr:methionine gamma-lyase family protein [Clostridia bacterium]